MSKEITNIVFYKNTSVEGKDKPRACIFYSDKTYFITTKKEAKQHVKKLFSTQGIYINYFNYLNEKYIYYIEESIFGENFEAFLNNNTEQIEQIEKITPKDPFWKKAGIAVTIIFIMVLIEICNGIEKKETTQPPEIESTISYLDQDLSQPDNAYQNILSQIANKSIKSIFNKTRDFLYYYNIENAIELSEQDIKPAMTFDEVTLLNVILNDTSLSKVNTIYEGQTPDENELKTMYLNAFNQLVLSYIVDKDGHFTIEKLIDDEEEKKEYKKYLDSLTRCKTKQGFEQEKEIKSLCQMVRRVYLSEPKEKKKQYLSIIPLITATQILFSNLNIEEFLTLDEINTINCSFLYQKAKEKIEYIIRSTDFISGSPEIYEGLKYIVESDLIANKAYYISEEKRDLTLLSQFNSPNISDTSYLEIMLANYKIALENFEFVVSSVSTPTEKSTENGKTNMKKFDKLNNS